MDSDSVAEGGTSPLCSSPCLFEGATNLNGSFSEDLSLFRRPERKEKKKSYIRKSLFAGKRAADTSDDDELSPSAKKLRNTCFKNDLRKVALVNSSDCLSPEVHSIIQAVDKLSTKEELVADGSRDYMLPTVPGKHSDLRCISTETMARLLRGEFGDILTRTQIVDCRYPYEYEGGHIQGACNLYTKDDVDQLLDVPAETRPRVLIFHCEFSSERGPKMYRFLRNQDRTRNKDSYPALHYPEVYLLEGGYQKFCASHMPLCEPMSYKPMLHEDHSEDLRHFRVKSKSWAGNKQKPSRGRLATGRSLSFNI